MFKLLGYCLAIFICINAILSILVQRLSLTISLSWALMVYMPNLTMMSLQSLMETWIYLVLIEFFVRDMKNTPFTILPRILLKMPVGCLLWWFVTTALTMAQTVGACRRVSAMDSRWSQAPHLLSCHCPSAWASRGPGFEFIAIAYMKLYLDMTIADLEFCDMPGA
jgi:hypothetical protein